MAPTKSAAAAKATAAKKAVVKGTNTTVKAKVRTSPTFNRPKTLQLPRAPKYPRKSIPSKSSLVDQYSVIRYPLNTEPAMKCVEKHNTIVFICDVRANKHHIKKAVKAQYNVGVHKVNTLIRPDGLKKAFVRLTPDCDALDVASKIGLL
ncbi:hypothetical protein CXG81DRAFT_26831 [Caulochytrium protostelioides]|uniref:Large ribosomal subunit protein uL23 N-terminal domain-containing protein n=1 Tax=Caulochytrium protostelioides TaxID=1555241 RepID=A0A4P9X5Q9_9FUNG|nr:hypothetical protein CXG81DRAFT_26831 [Caulochytrium protostelioides]|eukprot:RKP00476.1 hypothetical protein CXG81DRAFT_26831 [Caulochytrium protostelioides]